MTKFIYADVVSGCQSISSEDAYDYGGIIKCDNYLDSDSALKVAELSIVLEVSDEIYSKVDDEYGIKEAA